MTPQRRLTISSLILLGYTLILAALAGLGWFATSNMAQLQAITQDLYTHPFAVSNAAADLKGALFQLRSHMLQSILIRKQNENLGTTSLEAEKFARRAREDLEIIKSNFLGDMKQVAELENKLNQWDNVRARILQAAKRGDFASAEYAVKMEGSPVFAEIEPLVDYVLEFAKDRGKRFASEADEHADQIISRTLWLIAILITLAILSGIGIFYRVKLLHDELDRQATTDALTNISNRRFFMEQTNRELDRSRRYGTPLALAVIDLDFFKNINDTYGHPVGDHTLKTFCAICQKSLRSSDILGRIGGEEFAILLPNTPLPQAYEIIERIRKTVAESEIMTGLTPPLRLTASFGLGNHSPADEDLMTLFRRADQALYTAKENGRNQVCSNQAHT